MDTQVKKLSFYREPGDIFAQYYEEPMAVFLDSSLENQLGSCSIIGLYPYLCIKEEDGQCYRNDLPVNRGLEELLREYLREKWEENPSNLPFLSGAVGYFTYDYGRKFEGIASRHPKEISMPEAMFCFYDVYIIADLKHKELYLTVRGETEDKETLLARVEDEIKNCGCERKRKKQFEKAVFQANFSQAEYKNAIRDMVGYMEEGHIYVANMTQQLTAESRKEPYEVFSYLRQHNPAPFGSYMNYGSFRVVSASVERFLRIKEGRIETRPIKGTRKRGDSPEEDDNLRKELENSEKDKSELLMIVDLERNDLNRVCEPGSVIVTEHFKVEEYATVFQLVSTIQGKLKQDMDALDVIAATYPGGSITGAPKIRAMEIIDELEHGRRGLYTGSIGYLSFNGDCDFNIVIRTAVWEGGTYHLGVGGGITYESDVEFEYEETLQKAKAVLEAAYESDKTR